jgi:small-conductance mechanosensitive channel
MISLSLSFRKTLFAFCFLFLGLQTSHADIEYKLTSGSSGLDKATVVDCRDGYFCIKPESTGNFLQNAFNLAVGISISVAVLLLIFQGTALILAEYGIGGLAASGVAKAQHKSDMLNPIIGLIIVFCSVVVIRTLNPDLLNFPIFEELNFTSHSSTD